MPFHSIFDCHCHIQEAEFDADRDAVLARMREAAAGAVVASGSIAESRRAVDLCLQHPHLVAAIGLHPNRVMEEEWNSKEYELLAAEACVRAIGEIGLDYFYLSKEPAEKQTAIKVKQIEVFMEQLRFAKDHGKPVMIHCREAYDDLLAILKPFANLPIMIHTFVGGPKVAKQFLDLGCMLSYSGIVTFPNAEIVRESVKVTPLDRMLIETDAPYLAPVPHRGKRNEPVFVTDVAKGIADVVDLPPSELMQRTAENAERFFQIANA